MTFHAKGAPRVMKENDAAWVRMCVSNQLRAIANGFEIVASFPELKDIPIVIGESDPEGCAACPVRTNPHNAYRNGTMYSSYTAEQIARTYELADLHKVNLLGIGDVGVRVRGSAVLRRLPRPGDERPRQAGA